MINAVVQFSDNKIAINEQSTKYVGDKFNPGYYSCWIDSNGNFHISQEFLKEEHTPYNTRSNRKILKTVESFFAPGVRAEINQLGFIHKLGILTHGRQGTGKTSLLNYIATSLMEKADAIIFICNDQSTLGGGIRLANMVREIQDNPIVFVADEFDQYAAKAEAAMKIFLDGSNSIDNMLFLAATNYIEKIPKTLSDRPSRFKVVEEISGIEDKKLIRRIITDISSRIDPGLFTADEVEEVVKVNTNLTMDEIKHICLDKATNNYLPKAVAKNKIGFKITENDRKVIEDRLNEDEEEENTSWLSFSFSSRR
jgi:SpoVK/Ycf46/Vps4 family AAA+-type ATPase